MLAIFTIFEKVTARAMFTIVSKFEIVTGFTINAFVAEFRICQIEIVYAIIIVPEIFSIEAIFIDGRAENQVTIFTRI